MKMNSINKVVLKYFLIFSIGILIFLWVFQGLFLNSYYKYVKTNDIKNVGKKLENMNTNQIETNLDDISFNDSVCISIFDENGNTTIKSMFMDRGCFIDNGENSLINEFINSNKDKSIYELNNPDFNNTTLVYILKLNNNKYALINASLVPINSTASIIKSQLIIVTFIVLILSFIVAYFISRYLSKPIIEINNKSKKLGKGNLKEEININTNILEIKELANTLDNARCELEITDNLRRDLMANVSHDMKTPLTMIKAYAEMMIDLHKDNKIKRKKDGEIIIEETDRLANLVDDISILSKMQSNIDELKLEEFDLIKLINKILDRYKIFEDKENYVFEFIHDKDKLIINADKKKIEQVIYNLINNSINYVGDDKKVIIKLEKNKISIIDHGSGIKEEDLSYIWDRYYKNKKLHKRGKVGTGLGLSIVKNILEMHKYKYGVNSKLGEGTEFWFIIK